LRTGGFTTLVVSGGHSATFEMLCDRLAAALAPRSARITMPGRAHAVQFVGEPFNTALESFLVGDSSGRPPA
jgi:hypothetical protein